MYFYDGFRCGDYFVDCIEVVFYVDGEMFYVEEGWNFVEYVFDQYVEGGIGFFKGKVFGFFVFYFVENVADVWIVFFEFKFVVFQFCQDV